MSAGFVTAHLDAIEPIVFDSDDEPDWRPLRHDLGIGAFGVNAWVAKAPGDQAIERHDEALAAIRVRARAFWENHVLTGIAPEPTQLSDMNVLHPMESAAPALLADDELTSLVLKLRAANREIAARTAEMDTLEFEIKKAMGDCSELIVHGKSAISWKQRPHTHLDQAALKESYPEIHRELLRKGSSRVFQLKSFAWRD